MRRTAYRSVTAAFVLALCSAAHASAEPAQRSDIDQLTSLQNPSSVASFGIDETALTIAVARAHAERLARQGAALRTENLQVRSQTSPRFMTIEGQKGTKPFAIYAWLVPEPGAPRHLSIEVITELLAGESSALKQELGSKVSASATIESWISNVPQTVWGLQVIANAPGELDIVEQCLTALFQRWRKSGLSPSELAIVSSRGASASDVSSLLAQELSDLRRTTIEVYPGSAPHFATPRRSDENETDELPSAELEKKSRAQKGKRGAEASRTAKEVVSRKKRAELAEDEPRAPDEKPKSAAPKKSKPSAEKRKPKALAKTHVVKKGETLLGIAHRYRVGVSALLALNGIAKESVIIPGQRLMIPVKAP